MNGGVEGGHASNGKCESKQEEKEVADKLKNVRAEEVSGRGGRREPTYKKRDDERASVRALGMEGAQAREFVRQRADTDEIREQTCKVWDWAV
eukprot:6208897-Pleurochrysis_carterae.AAC.4